MSLSPATSKAFILLAAQSLASKMDCTSCSSRDANNDRISLDVLAMSGATQQSVHVPMTMLGRDLLALVMMHHHRSRMGRLLNGMVPIDSDTSLAKQGIVPGSQLTLVSWIPDGSKTALVEKMIRGHFALDDDELYVLNSIPGLFWDGGALDHMPLPSGLVFLNLGPDFNHSLDNTILPSGNLFGFSLSTPPAPPHPTICKPHTLHEVGSGRGGSRRVRAESTVKNVSQQMQKQA